ncbi:MAG: hypothetical protein LIP03_05060 [Bacteroidales bacterium]|nr:hypothetical protein [Bacteroidales bacterium]
MEATPSLNSTAYYLEMLSPLSNAEKLELISRLIESMKPKARSKAKSTLSRLKSFEGSWGGDTPVNDYVDGLRSNLPPRDITW